MLLGKCFRENENTLLFHKKLVYKKLWVISSFLNLRKYDLLGVEVGVLVLDEEDEGVPRSTLLGDDEEMLQEART